MKHNMFTIYDEKAKAFLPPFFLPEKGMALRAFGDCVNSPQHAFSKHPADYTLFCVGSFDDKAGAFAIGTMESMANGVMMVDREDTPNQTPLQLEVVK